MNDERNQLEIGNVRSPLPLFPVIYSSFILHPSYFILLPPIPYSLSPVH